MWCAVVCVRRSHHHSGDGEGENGCREENERLREDERLGERD